MPTMDPLDGEKQALVDQMLAASRHVLADFDRKYEAEFTDIPTEDLFRILCGFVFSLRDAWSFEHIGVLAAASILERYRPQLSLDEYEADLD